MASHRKGSFSEEADYGEVARPASTTQLPRSRPRPQPVIRLHLGTHPPSSMGPRVKDCTSSCRSYHCGPDVWLRPTEIPLFSRWQVTVHGVTPLPASGELLTINIWALLSRDNSRCFPVVLVRPAASAIVFTVEENCAMFSAFLIIDLRRAVCISSQSPVTP